MATYHQTVILTNPAAQNPFTIEPGGVVSVAIGDGVVGTAGFAWTLTNYGTVAAPEYGIDLTAGGFITNGRSGSAEGLIAGHKEGVVIAGGSGASGTVVNYGTIRGSSGVALVTVPGTVVNFGTVLGTGTAGVDLKFAGTVFNSGAIAGAVEGVILESGGVAVNSGLIDAYGAGLKKGGAAVDLASGGMAMNSGRIVAAYTGISLGSGGTVVNSGTIRSLYGDAIGAESGSGPSMVVNYGLIDAHSVAVAGIVGLTNFGTIFGKLIGVAAGPGATIVNYGTIADNSAFYGGTLPALEFAGSGAETVINFGTITAEHAALPAVSFGNGADVLVLEPGAVLVGALVGFGGLDTIDLAQQTATGAVFSGGRAGGTLTIMDGGTVVDTLSLIGQFVTGDFALSADGYGGTDIAFRQPTGRYIAGTYTSTVLLSNPAYDNAATVTSTGLITTTAGDAVDTGAAVAGTLVNYGTVMAAATDGRGVYLNAGGLVTNGGIGLAGGAVGSPSVRAGGGLIAGAGVGVEIAGSAGAVLNFATITGGAGVVAGPGATVTNAGTIIGYGGTAVMLTDPSDRLIIDASGVFQGVANGGGGVLELAPAVATAGTIAAEYIGTLPGIGSSFVNFGTLVVDAGAAWEASGDGSAYPFLNDGTIIVANGIVASGETLGLGVVGADPGQHGVIQVGGSGFVDFAGAVANSQTLVFTDATGTLQLADPGAFAARISGFQSGDVIDLIDVNADHFTYSKGKLRLTEAGQSVAVLTFAGHYTAAEFQLSNDGNGGTDIVLGAPLPGSPAYQFGLAIGPPAFWTMHG